MTPEALARQRIDDRLAAAGWLIQDVKQLNLGAGPGVAVREYGRGFDEKNLRRMVQFAELFPGQDIVVTLSRQLSWSHFLALLPVKDPLARDFYAQMCSIERWSVRTLRERVDSMLFERTALS